MGNFVPKHVVELLSKAQQKGKNNGRTGGRALLLKWRRSGDNVVRSEATSLVPHTADLV